MRGLHRVFSRNQPSHKQHVQASPPKILALGFLVLVLAGTFFLKIPFSTTTHLSWFEALLAATSAVTVTGLSIFDVSTTLTFGGKIVVIVLVQTCGLGCVTCAILAASTSGKRFSIRQQPLAMEAFNQ